MFRNKSVDVHAFAMIPSAQVPRSSFKVQHTHKTTFDSGWLVPVYCEEVLPGDTFKMSMTAFCRMTTPLFPIMDNLHLESFFFFVPTRLVWSNWKKFNGEQTNPGDSVSYEVPQVVSPLGGYQACSLQDYFGLPTVGQVSPGLQVSTNALPLRAYNLIFNEWFRDENLVNGTNVRLDDGPDPVTDFNLLKRGKRHDYFTSCLPWPQKGPSVESPLGTKAPVRFGTNPSQFLGATSGTQYRLGTTSGNATPRWINTPATTEDTFFNGGPANGNEPFADLTLATAATINQIRQAFQIQRLLERDARGGTRYTEILRAHFGVTSPDARLQRPEYLGGGHTSININPIAQNSATGQDGSSTPLGTLGAMGTAVANRHGFRQSFTEHGYIIGLVNVRADLTYQQGLRKMWSRKTRFDFYWPAFAMLGEQAVLNKEIYVTGNTAQDDAVFGYQERWAEYRYNPSRITGLFKSTATGTIDAWHLAQRFANLPTLNQTFIEENVPMDRVLAVTSQVGKHFYFDSFFEGILARPMPMYSVPGMMDHF